MTTRLNPITTPRHELRAEKARRNKEAALNAFIGKKAEIDEMLARLQALSDVSIDFHRGAVKGLVGENGSGKSTLVNIISGVYPPTSGTLELNGQPYAPTSSYEAYNRRIGTITQEMGTIASISVADNLFLGEEGRFMSRGIIDRRAMLKAAGEIFQRFGIRNIKPESMTGAVLDANGASFVR